VAADKKEENKVNGIWPSPEGRAGRPAGEEVPGRSLRKEAESNPKRRLTMSVINLLAGSAAHAHTNDYLSAEKT
jgi:hypothetical protein